jgi:hypothetical protein
VKDGYAASITEAMALTAPIVLQAFAYERYLDEFEKTYLEMNRCLKE